MLKARDIHKRFGAVRALEGVSLCLRPGRVHAVLGENGAGKSTLMKVLYGLIQPDAGELRLEGRTLRLRSPADAIARGIGMVHQHFTLVPTLTAAANVALGRRSPLSLFHPGRVAAEIEARAEELGLRVDPGARVEHLSVGERQRLEILKALVRGARVLVLDEPTGVLSPLETRDLFRSLRLMRDRGVAIAFISHKLWEVRELADDVTVLRRGRVTLQAELQAVSGEQLLEAVLGDASSLGATPALGEGALSGEGADPPSAEGSTSVLSLVGVSAPGEGGRGGLREVTLEVREGEVLGVAGVEGSGQRELAEVVVGLRRPRVGEVRLRGRGITGLGVAERRALGLGYIPEDRHRDALILPFSVRENLSMNRWASGRSRGAERSDALGPWLDTAASRRRALQLIREFDIRVPDPDTPLSSLSGGNQQKVVVARELSEEPSLLVAANPTRGLDVAATTFVHEALRRHQRRGGATLLISSELEELRALSDRIAVLHEGRVAGEVPASAGTEAIGRLMLGERPTS